MMNYFWIGILGVALLACSEEKSAEKEVETPSNQKEEKKLEGSDKRMTAVYINDQLSLSQAQGFVLIDSLLKIEDLKTMNELIPEIQLEIIAIKHRVSEIETEIDGAQEFQRAVLNQLDYIETGLKSEIPAMIKIATSDSPDSQKVADNMYFEWIKLYQEKSEKILAAQMHFAEKHNIKIN